MNQNPPPRGPYDQHFGADRNEFGQDPNALQNQQNQQQGHYPTPPPPGPGMTGHPPAGGYPHPPGHYPPPYPPGYGANPRDTAVMQTKDWLIMILICMIPCVNIVMLFVWAFSNNGNHNRRNYARAYLIFMGILIGLYILAIVFFGAMLSTSLWWI